MTQTASPRSLAMEDRVRSPVGSCEICVGKTGTGTGFFGMPQISLVSSSYSSLSASCLYQNLKWAKPGNLATSSAVSEMVIRSIQKYFHSFFESLKG